LRASIYGKVFEYLGGHILSPFKTKEVLESVLKLQSVSKSLCFNTYVAPVALGVPDWFLINQANP